MLVDFMVELPIPCPAIDCPCLPMPGRPGHNHLTAATTFPGPRTRSQHKIIPPQFVWDLRLRGCCCCCCCWCCGSWCKRLTLAAAAVAAAAAAADILAAKVLPQLLQATSLRRGSDLVELGLSFNGELHLLRLLSSPLPQVLPGAAAELPASAGAARSGC